MAVVAKKQRPLGIGEERPAGLCETHAAAPADEQRRADGLFERVQPRGQGRLRDEQGLGRARDGAEPRRLDERLQLRMHRVSLCK